MSLLAFTYRSSFVRPSTRRSLTVKYICTGPSPNDDAIVAGSLNSQQSGARQSSPGRPLDGRVCMTSPLHLARAGETAGRSASSDRTGSVRRSRICVGTLPATSHTIRKLRFFRNWFAGIRCPAFDQQRRCSFRAVADHDGRCPWETASPPITIDVHSDVSRALSQESHRHPHGLHPYVQYRTEHTPDAHGRQCA